MNLFTSTNTNGDLIQIDINGNVVKNSYNLGDSNTVEIKMGNLMLHSENSINMFNLK